ncbi:Eco57I restriction-modification methylase domain-containing protein [Companilactobacillus mishanensis]|uniref:Eco57I restriction-modification methylase domain-containing protein n=1 Tax=Companilactobacillus mishanensis TaxID=2486008 RepID=UPI0012960374|nr:Eco57I restriction-modification methylase domain-containing protein [Companilactobacillus mishanensis]MQS89719.1 hypothetical protein [Companilactobacillus mishanensis]
MKFDVVVGNPPYQEENIGKNNQATPIYNLFYNLAEKVGREYVLISPARFLSNQGATPKSWNRKMLQDNHVKIEYFNSDSSILFNNVDIKGGVVILYRNEKNVFDAIDTFIPFEELRNIYLKVSKATTDAISTLVFSPDSYRLTDNLFKDYPKLIGRTDKSHAKAVSSSIFTRYPEVFFENDPQDGEQYVRIYGRQSGERLYRWVKKDYVSSHPNLDKWKVIVPGANGKGTFGETLSSPIVGEPEVGHNQTFVSIGKFDSEYQAQSLLKYIKSKFGRAMLDIMKTTQNNQSKATWSKVPMQNFTENSDIDWKTSISEIDKQLYEKYNLNEQEISFIENKVKPMD